MTRSIHCCQAQFDNNSVRWRESTVRHGCTSTCIQNITVHASVYQRDVVMAILRFCKVHKIYRRHIATATVTTTSFPNKTAFVECAFIIEFL